MTKPKATEEQASWARTLIATCVQHGLTDLVVSPGSRSTPLLLAALDSPLRLHTIIDERAAAFFALGIARVDGRAPILLCTSGSAAGHYLPAVMEASASSCPLVLLTADRPPELHGSGANQTTNQTNLYGTHVRHFVDVGAPTGQLAALSRRITQAITASQHPHPGPVHINVPARKPLEGRGAGGSPRVTRVRTGRLVADDNTLDAIGEVLSRGERPAIVAGPASVNAKTTSKSISALASCLGAPILADITSQMTGLPFLPEFDPDVVLQIGRVPISSQWDEWARGRSRVVLTPHTWSDPTHDAELVVVCDIEDTATRLANGLRERAPWCAAYSESVSEALASVEADSLGHASVSRRLSERVPRSGYLCVGNSLAVRHLDLFGSRRAPAVLHQRGLSGIDGLVSAAAGAATRGAPVALLLGDISFLHDASGLMWAPKDTPLVVVVVNDRGGRIFERLPIRSAISSEAFEAHFATHHQVDLGACATSFGAEYIQPSDLASYDQALKSAFARNGATVIEVNLPADAGQRTQTALREALAGVS